MASGVYETLEETLALAPKAETDASPRDVVAYADAYVRYRELYPRLRG